ncbi:MAG TPA: transglycosylase SLT domain-containing protein [Nitrospirales bacterium]|nr:transglycosylase SLT domain-containing protein [Nitrospirales bacterium]
MMAVIPVGLFAASPTPPMPCTEAAPCLAQAVGALSQRDYDQAVRLLLELIEQFPNTPWAGRAELALGKYYQDQGDRQAVPFLLAARQHLPILGDYAYGYLGEVSFKRSDFNGSATAFDLVVDQYPDSLLKSQALARSVEAWFQGEDCRRSRERQVRFLSEYSGHAMASAVLLRQGDCQQKNGEASAAVAAYRRIWTQYAASYQADEAAMRLERLKGEGIAIPELTPEDRWVRAKALFDAGQYLRAVKAFEDFLKSSPVAAQRDQARLKLAIARVRLKHYEEARANLEEVVRSGTDSTAQEAIVWLARVFLRQSLDEPFLALAKEVEKGRLSGEPRARFLLLLAAQHADRGRFEQAIQTYQQVGEKEQMEGPAAEGYYRAGWLLYKGGRYEDATRSFDQVLRLQQTGSIRLAALYWKARSLEKAGDVQKGAALFQSLCGDAPLSYYCQNARLRSVATDVNGPKESLRLVEIEPREKSVTTDVHYQRAVELRMVGLSRESGEEMVVLTGRLGGDRGEILWLAEFLKNVGDYHRALKLVQLFFLDVIDRGNAGVPPAFWELAYPRGLLPTIQALANRGTDPYLVAAIIREESTYDPAAVSQTGALGLMQVMPQTGQMVANRVGGTEPFSRERLFDPPYNIRLGSWYLGYLAEKFDRKPVYAIAAYNAGPEAVTKWVQQFGNLEPDEFIESIPYTETRLYVKRVLRSYREYRRVNGQECAATTFEKVC